MRFRVVAEVLAAGALATSFRPSWIDASLNVRTVRDVIGDGIAALGGANAIRAVRSMRIQYAQEVANKGQEEWPGAPTPWFTPADVIEVMDFSREASSTQNALPRATPPYLTVIMNGDLGMVKRDTVLPGSPSMSWSVTSKRRVRLEPISLMQRALGADASALQTLKPRRLRGRLLEGVDARLGLDTVQLWFDAQHHTLSAVGYSADDPIRGPVETLMEYANWTRLGNVVLPFTMHRSENGMLMQVNTATKIEINPPGVDSLLSVPDKYRVRDFGNAIRYAELSPGVWRLQFSTHTPMVVVQGDSLVLLEAPIGDAFMRVVFDSLRSHFPDKRVKSFVVTHHHWDHTSGVRAAFAAGLTAIVQSENADFVRSIGGVSASVAKSRRVRTVDDSLTVGTGPTRFTLYHIPTSHARGLMMAYFPETKLMFEVDLAQGPPNDRQDLYDFITGRGLQVAKFARIHGQVMDWEAFAKTVPSLQKPAG